MNQKRLALSAISLVFTAIAAIPTVAQAAIEQPDRAQVCHSQNEVRTRFGLPAADCGTTDQIRAVSTKPNEQRAGEKSGRAQQCQENEMRARFGLPAINCAA
jgi:hypothetical protein